MNFFEALMSPNFVFLRNAVFAGFLSSVLFGVLGTIVTVKRIASLAGAISHAVLGGIGLALYVSYLADFSWFTPVFGAIVFALIAALVIGFVSLKVKQREDTVINAVWAIGMSLGVLFMAKTPGYTDPSSYLFGNILLVSNTDLLLLFLLDCVVIFLAWKFYPQIVASSFDEEFTRIRGVHTDVVFISILIITAISVVLLQTFVGIVMVIAMLTLPAGIAGYTSKTVAGMMFGATILSLLCTESGIYLSWNLDVPSGALIVIFSGILFLATSVIRLCLIRYKKKKAFKENL